MMRPFLVCCLMLGLPADLRPDTNLKLRLGGIQQLATAIITVRFDSHRLVRIDDEQYAEHTGTVMARHKDDARIPDNGGQLNLYEISCAFCAEEFVWRPWDTAHPIPVGSHKVVALTWDEEVRGYRIFAAVY